ncbi:MAG: glycosyltransferase [Deltaproteobacteria bacterium]|nr:glycosyltransferase [Deltaproteobacteria bacterium]
MGRCSSRVNQLQLEMSSILSSRPRVLVVNKFYPPWIGGIEKAAALTVESLRHEIDFSVLVCSPDRHGSSQIMEGATVLRAPSVGVFWSMPVSFRFMALYQKLVRDCDMVHFHEPFPMGTWVGWRYGFPCGVLTYHSDIHRQRFLNLAYQPIFNRFLHKIDLIMPTSARLAAHSRSLSQFGHKLRPVPLGIEDQAGPVTPAQRDQIQAIRKSAQGRTVFFNVGRMVSYKGLDVLLDAMQYCPFAILYLVGDGPERPRLERLTQKLGLTEQVRFCGMVPDKDLPGYFRAADVFALPSNSPAEAFGLTQLEAMSYGLPVINTDLFTGVPDVSLHGRTGLTVPVNNSKAFAAAMTTLSEDAGLRETFGKNARERFESLFTLAVTAKETLKVYQEALTKKRRRKL